MSKRGFTLAEVLITLGIIGVVVAMTIPTLINNYRNKVLETQFKTAYSLLQNAMNAIRAENPNLYEEIQSYDKFYNGGAYMVLKPALEEHFRKSGEFGKSIKFSSLADLYRNYDNTQSLSTAWGNYGQFSLINGMLIFTDCVSYCSSVHVLIDINGIKNPNRSGHDLFAFQLNKNSELLPSTYFGRVCGGKTWYAGLNCTVEALSNPDYFKNLPR